MYESEVLVFGIYSKKRKKVRYKTYVTGQNINIIEMITWDPFVGRMITSIKWYYQAYTSYYPYMTCGLKEN